MNTTKYIIDLQGRLIRLSNKLRTRKDALSAKGNITQKDINALHEAIGALCNLKNNGNNNT